MTSTIQRRLSSGGWSARTIRGACWTPRQQLLVVVVVAMVVASSSSPALAEHQAMQGCPALSPMRQFSPGQFLGTWHVYQQYRVKEEEGMACKRITLKQDGSVSFDFNAQYKPLSVKGTFLVDASSTGLLQAKFDYSDVLGSDESGEVLWYILDTDYKTYAILAACQHLSTSNRQFLYILSRDVEPSGPSAAKMDVSFSNAHLIPGGQLMADDKSKCLDSASLDVPLTPAASISSFEIKNSIQLPDQLDGLSNFPGSLSVTGVTGASNKPPIIHINIADSHVSLNGDALSSPLTSGANPFIAARPKPTSAATAPVEASESTPATASEVETYPPDADSSNESVVPPGDYTNSSLYEEIPLLVEDDEEGNLGRVHPRVAAFIDRLKRKPSFVEWSEVVQSPTFRSGAAATDARVDVRVQNFISSLKNRPNYLDFAKYSNEALYRK